MNLSVIDRTKIDESIGIWQSIVNFLPLDSINFSFIYLFIFLLSTYILFISINLHFIYFYVINFFPGILYR